MGGRQQGEPQTFFQSIISKSKVFGTTKFHLGQHGGRKCDKWPPFGKSSGIHLWSVLTAWLPCWVGKARWAVLCPSEKTHSRLQQSSHTPPEIHCLPKAFSMSGPISLLECVHYSTQQLKGCKQNGLILGKVWCFNLWATREALYWKRLYNLIPPPPPQSSSLKVTWDAISWAWSPKNSKRIKH